MLPGATEELAKALEFTALDLAANQRGELSEAQRSRLESTRAAWQRAADSSRPWMIGLGVLSVGVSVAYAIGGLVRGQNLLMITATAAMMALGGLGLLAWYGRKARSLVSPLPRRVESIAGAVTLDREKGDGWDQDAYLVRVGRRQFNVGAQAQRAFVDGQSYRLYFIVTGGLFQLAARSGLLSAEATPAS